MNQNKDQSQQDKSQAHQSQLGRQDKNPSVTLFAEGGATKARLHQMCSITAISAVCAGRRTIADYCACNFGKISPSNQSPTHFARCACSFGFG